MHAKGRFPNVVFGASLRPDSVALAIMVLLLFLIFVFLFLTLTAQPARRQTYRVIHSVDIEAGAAAEWRRLVKQTRALLESNPPGITGWKLIHCDGRGHGRELSRGHHSGGYS